MRELDIATPDGTSHAALHGEGGASRPAVLLFTDAGGPRASMAAVARRLADDGYVVLVPDLFYRSRPFPPFDFQTVWTTPPERERLMALLRATTAPERAEVDARAFLDALAASPSVRTDRVATLGYCVGGRLAFLAAGQHPERVRAVASFHGGGVATDAPESPHRLAPRVKAALYFGVADGDGSCTPAQQGQLAAALGEAHLDYRIELYAGKRHGFAVPDHAAAYDRDAWERHWRRLEAFLAETIGA